MPSLFSLLGRFRRRESASQPDTADAALERFFTDAEDAQRRFKELASADPLSKRILVVHGVGAVGKSSLLKMYRLFCRRERMPVALAEGAPSAADLLARWAADLEGGGMSLPAFQRTLDRYRKLQAKVDTEAQKAGLTEAAAKIIVGGGSMIPGAGPFIAAVGSEAVEEALNFLRAKLAKRDFDFYRDPTSGLTDDFLIDITEAAEQRRVVLMLDAFEQITALGEWLRELIQRLPNNVLVVVAGRVLPDWDQPWPGWRERAELVELMTMSDPDVETLVRRYYSLFDRGEPQEQQVREVVVFARGLPLAATTAVDLWVKYQVSDLQPLHPEAVADVADQLLRGVPPEDKPAFEAAALLRTFNADSLGALVDGKPGLYEELRRWPFTRPGRGGLAVHDLMRQVINDDLRSRSPQQFRRLHEKAAAHYATLLETAAGDERARLGLEWLYHTTGADEAKGIHSFAEMAEELVRYQSVGRLRSLLNEANTFPLQEESRGLWRRYYAARLEHLEGRTATAEAEYRAISESDSAEPRLRAYAFCDLGTILAALERLAEPGGEERAQEAVRRSMQIQPELDSKLMANYFTLMNISNARAAWDESGEHLRRLRELSESAGDAYGLVVTDLHRAAVYGLQGNWRGYLSTRREYKAAVDRLGDVPALRMQISYFTWPLVFMGRYREAQESSEEAFRLAMRLEEKELLITILESVALALGAQEDHAAAAEKFAEAQNFYENFHAAEAGRPERYIRAMLSFRGLVALREGKLEDAEADLERALQIKQSIGDRIGTPEVLTWRGQLHELRDAWDEAEAEYRRVLELRAVSRNYFECSALAGLARVYTVRERPSEAGEAAAAAEAIADRYEYNDLLASLRLTDAHAAAESRTPQESEFDDQFRLYSQALVYALRFNWFMLDEVLIGRPQGTALRPIIPSCLERGAVGRRMLEALESWWRSGTNELDRRRETVSPLEVGARLVDAERAARALEPGAGGAQLTVLERLEAALG